MKRLIILATILIMAVPTMSTAGEKEDVAARIFGAQFKTKLLGMYQSSKVAPPSLLTRQLNSEWPELKQKLVELFCEAYTLEELKHQERTDRRDARYTAMLDEVGTKEMVGAGKRYIRLGSVNKERLVETQAMIESNFFYMEQSAVLTAFGSAEGLAHVAKKPLTRAEYKRIRKAFTSEIKYLKKNIKYVAAWTLVNTPEYIINERLAEYRSGIAANIMMKYNSIAQRFGFAIGQYFARVYDTVGMPIR